MFKRTDNPGNFPPHTFCGGGPIHWFGRGSRISNATYICQNTFGQDRFPFALYVRNDNRRPKLVKPIASCGARDMDDPQPAITVMMPEED